MKHINLIYSDAVPHTILIQHKPEVNPINVLIIPSYILFYLFYCFGVEEIGVADPSALVRAKNPLNLKYIDQK